MQSCLDIIAQGFLPVQYCPKSIKTTLNRIFTCAMLSGTSWAIAQGFYLCNVDPWLTDNFSE